MQEWNDTGRRLYDQLKRKAHYAASDIRWAAVHLQQLVNHTKLALEYDQEVKKDQDQKANVEARVFTEEFLSFLREIFPAISSQSNLNREQKANINDLLSAIESNALSLIGGKGILKSGDPYLTHSYKVKTQREGKPHYISLTIIWDVNYSRPLAVRLGGSESKLEPIEFIAFGKKPERPDDVDQILGERVTGVDTKLSIYRGGERILQETSFDNSYGGESKHVQNVNNYHFLSSFDGLTSNRPYCVYMHNTARDKKETITAQQTFSQAYTPLTTSPSVVKV